MSGGECTVANKQWPSMRKHLHISLARCTCVSVESSPGAGRCCSAIKYLGGWCGAAVVFDMPQHQLAALGAGGQADDRGAKMVWQAGKGMIAHKCGAVVAL
jgi:hypothetical protein